MTNEQNLGVFCKQSLGDESITCGIDCGNHNLMELFSYGLPIVWNLFFPRSPVLLFLIDVELKHCVAVREHWLDVTKNVVDLPTACLVAYLSARMSVRSVFTNASCSGNRAGSAAAVNASSARIAEAV